jgi:thymidylate synthase (FAD)
MEVVHNIYKALLEVDIPPEDARYVLPNATETKVFITMNARTLLHFFEKRCCNRAQWEIRGMAVDMLKEVKKVAPLLFTEAGPGCVGGSCGEGSFTCGKAEDVRQRFRELDETVGQNLDVTG